jgi:hypothetical protein
MGGVQWERKWREDATGMTERTLDGIMIVAGCGNAVHLVCRTVCRGVGPIGGKNRE